MNKMTPTRLFITFSPIFILFAVLFFLWRGLSTQPDILPSALLGKPSPHFRLVNILSPTYLFTEQNFKGQVTLLNVWATWCYACEMEHAMLLEIKNNYHLAIYGILYKDNPENCKAFLRASGNPYSIIGNDVNGEVAMDFGVYGTPETFILDKKGNIVYRHIGAINHEIWENELLPIIKRIL